MFDVIVDQFFSNASDPVELALRFMLVVMVFDCIFGLINNLVNSSRSKV